MYSLSEIVKRNREAAKLGVPGAVDLVGVREEDKPAKACAKNKDGVIIKYGSPYELTALYLADIALGEITVEVAP